MARPVQDTVGAVGMASQRSGSVLRHRVIARREPAIRPDS